jgi:multisubunit Na+/H+ antiporter MnhB subunit
MIDGIDYYPRQKKRKVNFKLWVALLLLVMIVAYFYFDNKQTPDKSKPTLIVISKPEAHSVVSTIPIVIKASKIKSKKPEILENLDEVMQNYLKNNR